MQTFNVEINTKEINALETIVLRSGSFNVDKLVFSFTDDYDGLTKKALIVTPDGKSYDLAIIDDELVLPLDIYEKDFINEDIFIGVYAYEIEEDEIHYRYSPRPIVVPMREGSYDKELVENAENTREITTSDLELYFAKYNELYLKTKELYEQSKLDYEKVEQEIAEINTNIDTLNEITNAQGEAIISLTNDKQNKLIAGENITIDGDTISSAMYDDTNIQNHINSLTELIEEHDRDLAYIDNQLTYVNEELEKQEQNINKKQDKLIAGENITIVNNVISSTGGSGGTSDYNELENKPHINDIELSGSLTSHELGLINEDDVSTIMNNVKSNYVKDGLVNNTNQLTDQEKLKVETWLGLSDNYLTYYNETPYQVNKDYVPAHKKYVDEGIKELDDKVKELELFKFPNMTIVGTPTIQNGQVSNFTMNDYLEFPFLVDFRSRPFEINFAFTTGSNVTTQQNILDSVFGLAFAIKNSKVIMAISYNGTTWANQYTGSLTIESNTTYVYKIIWNGIMYKVQYYNGNQYVDDFYFASTQQPYPKQMFIGVSKLSDNYFEGSINLNYANLKVDGNVIWTRNGRRTV